MRFRAGGSRSFCLGHPSKGQIGGKGAILKEIKTRITSHVMKRSGWNPPKPWAYPQKRPKRRPPFSLYGLGGHARRLKNQKSRFLWGSGSNKKWGNPGGNGRVPVRGPPPLFLPEARKRRTGTRPPRFQSQEGEKALTKGRTAYPHVRRRIQN